MGLWNSLLKQAQSISPTDSRYAEHRVTHTPIVFSDYGRQWWAAQYNPMIPAKHELLFRRLHVDPDAVPSINQPGFIRLNIQPSALDRDQSSLLPGFVGPILSHEGTHSVFRPYRESFAASKIWDDSSIEKYGDRLRSKGYRNLSLEDIYDETMAYIASSARAPDQYLPPSANEQYDFLEALVRMKPEDQQKVKRMIFRPQDQEFPDAIPIIRRYMRMEQRPVVEIE